MCSPNLYMSQRKDAATVKGMITNYLEGRLICPVKTPTDHKANMYDIQAYLNTLMCRNIIGEWIIIPNENELTVRFKTTFITYDEMTICLQN
jgi:hypothetical protein